MWDVRCAACRPFRLRAYGTSAWFHSISADDHGEGPWRTVDAVELATAEWVDWYNYRRLNEYCGDMPPAVLEQVHYAHQQPSAAS